MQRLDRIHLDPVGGISGDMFAAALADAFPEAVPGLLAELAKLGAREGAVRVVAHSDGVVAGSRFVVESDVPPAEPHSHGHGHAQAHAHVPYRAVRERLRAARLEPAVLRHAEALFDLLAAAESEVHGIAKDEVEFHEVGAWDSIVDFVAAAYFIARLDPRAWTFSPSPLGG
ncbi:MAG TPA: nickel insertion protein, partial [Usitatibacter sp.]